MGNFGSNNYITKFIDDVLFSLDIDGFIIYDEDIYSNIEHGLLGFIQHKILTSEENRPLNISIKQQYNEKTGYYYPSNGLLYSLLCADINDEDSMFRKINFSPMNLPLPVFILKKCKNTFMEVLQFGQEFDTWEENILYPTDLLYTACDIRDSALLGDVPSEEQKKNYEETFEHFHECFEEGSLAGKIIDDIMNGELKDVIHDFAMRRALEAIICVEISSNGIKEDHSQIPYSKKAIKDLGNIKRYIKASSILNPDVNDVLLSYYEEAYEMVNHTDKKLVLFEPPLYTSLDNVSNTHQQNTGENNGNPVIRKVLPFRPRDSKK